ncbi:hypothetical protein B296_00048937 [Ensete ventricosum]|uniref:Uncharacterized protein n=1 Tax=Ensete ventricosum TaxID=4639 RepID=A0A426YEM6_ENSVE|nr:hypothetical protein B296_00048937 [Ensete ventricosum]
MRDRFWSCSIRCWSRSRQLAAKDYCKLQCRQIAAKDSYCSFLPQRIMLAAIKEDGSEWSLLAALCRIAAGCDQGGWQRKIAASSVVQRKMHVAIEGIREIGWPVGWIDLICDLEWKMEARVAAIVGIAWKDVGGKDGSKGSRNAALIANDRTPEGAL